MSAPVLTAVKAEYQTPTIEKALGSLWDQLISQFDAEPSLKALADFARTQRDQGCTFEAFADDMKSVAEMGRQSKILTEVFKLSKDDRWDMPQAAIEAAWDAIKTGDTAEVAYAKVKPQPSWAESVAAYEAAVGEYRRVVRLDNERDAEIYRRIASPELLRPSLYRPVGLRWSHEGAIDEDILLSAAEKKRLKPLLREFLSKRAEEAADPFGDDLEHLDNVVIDAEKIVLSAIAPDLSAALYQFRLNEREATDDKCGLDDLGYVAFLESEGYADRYRMQFFRNLLRLAGQDHPMLHTAPFDPRSWVDRYEATGGLVSLSRNDFIIAHPTFASATDEKQAAWLRKMLYAKSWRCRAVQLYADARRDRGGDPLFTSTGEPKSGAYPRLSLVDRIVAYDDGQHATGSMAMYSIAYSIDTVSVGPIAPTEEDFVTAPADRRDALAAYARRSDEGRQARANWRAFKPKKWVSEFQSHPGHIITCYGELAYIDPIAWGPEMPAFDAIQITDPEAISRWEAKQRSHYSDAQWAQHVADPHSYKRPPGTPVIVDHQQRLDFAYPEGGAEYDRLLELYQRRLNRHNPGGMEPLGGHLWRDLSTWQRKAVKAYIRANQNAFPDRVPS